jgi:hypothetical protein
MSSNDVVPFEIACTIGWRPPYGLVVSLDVTSHAVYKLWILYESVYYNTLQINLSPLINSTMLHPIFLLLTLLTFTL